MQTKQNIARHEWIGLDARVERADDRALVGAEGRVVDETMKTLTLEKAGGHEVQVAKRGTHIAFTLPHGERAALDLTGLEMRPWDRVKRAKAARTSA